MQFHFTLMMSLQTFNLQANKNQKTFAGYFE